MDEVAGVRHDAGGKTRLSLLPGHRGGAVFAGPGDCHRLSLWREWGEGLDRRKPFALWIGMNPSTAEGEVDDPTIRKEIGFTQRAGLSRYEKCNVLPFRATNPKHLRGTSLPVWAPENLECILRSAHYAGLIVCAWGNIPHRDFVEVYAKTLAALEGLRKPLWCLGMNASGAPKHPLYVGYDKPLTRFA